MKTLSSLRICVLLLTMLFAAQVSAQVASVNCASSDGERQHCAANTSAGVLMSRSTGEGACLLGKTWGYDDAGVWVLDGCSAEFIVAGAPGDAPAIAVQGVAATEPLAPVATTAESRPLAPELAATAEADAGQRNMGFSGPRQGLSDRQGRVRRGIAQRLWHWCVT